jgi:O-succinylbenzoic acid--CoA ligase
VVLAPEAPFDARTVATLMRANDVTLASFVPIMLRRLLDLEGEELALPSRLRAILVGGAHAPSALLARAAARGVPVLATYGLTEACSQVATQRHPGEPGVGPPLPGVEVRIVDAEIEVRGPTLFDGYVGESAPISEGGWLRTGDLGSFDEGGNLHVGGRRDERIVTGGENVDPVEVEEVLLAHPQVRAACAFGVPDDAWGEVVGACVEAGAVSPDELVAHCRARLAPHKRPRRIAIVPSLPTTASGKPSRRAARALALHSAVAQSDSNAAES